MSAREDLWIHVKEQFAKDTVDHRVTIHKDDGYYRHVSCSKPGTNVYRFDLVTWPGHLAVSGDMGHFVFTRLTDMFEFFRIPEGKDIAENVSISYWLEKCCAGDKTEFREDIVRECIDEYVQQWVEDMREAHGLTAGEEAIFRDDLRGMMDVYDECGTIQFIDSYEHFFRGYIPGVGTGLTGPGFRFFFSEPGDWLTLRGSSYRALWALLAIAYGVRAYDQIVKNLWPRAWVVRLNRGD